jgi:FkbM family methyltransferase
VSVTLLGRPWQWWAVAPFESANYVGVWNALRVYRRPADSLRRYILGSGAYPYVCEVRTPLGDVAVELYSPHDMLTVHEVFCRLDYRTSRTVRTVVDVGSNIGVSALYFLSRNETAFCYLVEPDPRKKNLSSYSRRYTLDECAVSDSAGTVRFGIEESGRYGGVGLDLSESIDVRCREINDLLADVISEAGWIDVLKVDTEGLEEQTIRVIRPELLDRVGLIYLESTEPLEPLHPGGFVQSRRMAVTRLLPRR